VHLTREHALDHRTRHLAGTEALQLDVLAELLVSGVELLAHALPGDLDGDFLLDRGKALDLNLHERYVSVVRGCGRWWIA
jgi:hypothetical protein